MFPKSIFCFYLPGRFSYPLSVHAWFVTSTDLHDIIDNKSWRFVGWATTRVVDNPAFDWTGDWALYTTFLSHVFLSNS